MHIEPERLKKFLLDADLVSQKDFDRVLKLAQSKDIDVGVMLVEEGLIEQEKLTKFEAYILGIPFVNLEEEKIPHEVLNIIPEQIARAHNIIAFRKVDNTIEVAMLDPEDLITIDFIRKTNPLLRLSLRLTTPAGIKNGLRQYQKTLDTEFGDILKSDTGAVSHIEPDQDGLLPEKKEELLKASQELPIVKVVDTLLKHAILQRASDVHIEPLEHEVIVRFRIDGILHDVMTLPMSASLGVVARIKVLSNLKLDEHRLPQDGRFKIETEDYRYSIRVSVLPVSNGEKIVMRLLAENTKGQSLEELGFMGIDLDRVRTNLVRPTGMILISGPTGSGKTTTLYSMMEILNTPNVNISTIEDPIEYRMPRVNQTQVNPQIGLTFAAGLRALLRQDPNVIMVGEIRDGETASLGINAALTGHLVLSTIHTTEAAGTIPRLIDMGVEAFLIASTLNVIIAQRLVRKFHGEKESYTLKAQELEQLGKYCDLDRMTELLRQEKLLKPKETLKDIQFYRPKPSKDSASGYRGRMGIFEVLPINEAIKGLIVKRASTEEIMNQARKDGMKTMTEDGFVKAARGLTSLEEVLRVIVN